MGQKDVRRQAKRALRARNLTARRLQYGALCYRVKKSGPQVLLITSRRTRRWISPKGWPIRGLGPAATAAQEAYEEAGVRGQVSKTPIGFYSYTKIVSRKRKMTCLVQVFPLRVTDRAKSFPEMDERKIKWLPPAKAAKRVREAELAKLIRSLGKELDRQGTSNPASDERDGPAAKDRQRTSA